MSNFKKKKQGKKARTMPSGYSGIVVPTSYDGGKAHNRKEQRLVDIEKDQLNDAPDKSRDS